MTLEQVKKRYAAFEKLAKGETGLGLIDYKEYRKDVGFLLKTIDGVGRQGAISEARECWTRNSPIALCLELQRDLDIIESGRREVDAMNPGKDENL